MPEVRDRTFKVLEVLAILACLGTFAMNFVPHADVIEKELKATEKADIQVLKSQYAEISRRLIRIEDKLDTRPEK